MDSDTKQIAKNRVQTLLQAASAVHAGQPELSTRYVATARKIAMAARIRLPAEYRRRVCRRCNALLVPGSSCRVRIKQRREPHVVVTCLSCGFQRRVPLRAKRRVNQS